MQAPPGSITIDGLVYPILSILAIAFVYFTSFRQGTADGIDIRSWSVALVVRFLFFILGYKLFTVSASDFFSRADVAETLVSQRALTGGILLGLPVFIILIFYFKLPWRVMDYAPIPILAGLALQKVGCFAAGCCFGIVNPHAWSVTYSAASPAFLSQASRQLISSTETHSLPLHAVQLYEAAGYLLCALLVHRYKKVFHRPGTLIVFICILILFTRLITNFFRDPASYIVLGHSPSQLVTMQLSLAILILGLGLLLYFLMTRHRTAFRTVRKSPRPTLPWLLLTSLLILITVLWYNFYELAFLTTALSIAFYVNRKEVMSQAWARVTAMVVAILVLTAQTQPAKIDSIKSKEQVLKVGFTSGKFYNRVSDSDGCDARSRYFTQEHTQGGIGYGRATTRLRVNPKGKTYLSTQEAYYSVFFGTQREQANSSTSLPMLAETRFNVFGGSAQWRSNLPWIGAGIGVNVGNLRYAYLNDVHSSLEKGYWKTFVLPSAYFRFGPKHILFAEYSFAQTFPTSSPGLYSNLMVGTGFGLKNGLELKWGGIVGLEGQLLGLNLPLGTKLKFEGLYHFGKSYDGQGDKSQKQVSFALEYKIH